MTEPERSEKQGDTPEAWLARYRANWTAALSQARREEREAISSIVDDASQSKVEWDGITDVNFRKGWIYACAAISESIERRNEETPK